MKTNNSNHAIIYMLHFMIFLH